MEPLSPLDKEFSINPYDFNPFYNSYFRPWRWHMQNASKDTGSTITNEKDKFLVSLDVQQFKPNEISVKVNDREIIIEGKHEERQDEHGFISRHFVRRYVLPKECSKEDVTSNLSSDGVLIVMAKKADSITADRKVPIQFCDSITNGKATQKNGIEMDSKSTIAKKEEIKSEERIKLEETKKETLEEKVETKDAQMSLKEDHSRLLKPEFMSTSDTVDRLIQESKKRTDELLAEMGQCSKDSLKSSAMAKISAASESIGESIATLSESSSLAMTSEKGESSSMMSEMTSFSSKSSEVISEETSSFSSSSMKASGKTSEILSEIITAELREAAENL